MPTQKQLDLPLLRVVRLVASGTPVAAPDGLVYSTRPESWLDEGDAWWIVKGPEPEVVAAEAVGYLLAMETGIAVPSFALARRPGDESLLFASRKEHYRDVLPWLRRRREATLHSIAQICALDVMVGNRDRNLNNLLPPRTGGDDVIAIDFEKAVCVRSRHPLVESAEINPADLWPRGMLGSFMKGHSPPGAYVARVMALSDEAISRIVGTVELSLGGLFSWSDSVREILRRRRSQLDSLVREVWQ